MKISLESISKQFGRVSVLDNVSLDIQSGECFFLLGPSGCGKTTLLRIIAGFLAPDTGTIRFDDRVVNNTLPHMRNTSMVFQNYALWPHMTITNNVAFGLTVPGRTVPNPERTEKVNQFLKTVQMESYGDRKPGQLSGGQQQRIALARALVIAPDCLLLDEPLSNLDAKLRQDMRSEIKRLVKQFGITTIYVTHDQKEALSMADRCAVMRNGRVEQIGSPRELYEHPANRFVADFIGSANLIQGTVRGCADGTIRIDTATGEWISKDTRRNFVAGEKVSLAIRPETVRLANADFRGINVFTGTLTGQMYFGEMVEHTIELSQGIRIKAVELGPGQMGHTLPALTRLHVDPAAVSVLPDL